MNDILIVDDEKDIRELVSDILMDEGFIMRKASNSDETFAEINKREPDLIILDIWLKESKLDGIDILPGFPGVLRSGRRHGKPAVCCNGIGSYCWGTSWTAALEDRARSWR